MARVGIARQFFTIVLIGGNDRREPQRAGADRRTANQGNEAMTDTTTPSQASTTVGSGDQANADKRQVPKRNPNVPLKFVELGELSRGIESHGCDPYNSMQGQPAREVWKRGDKRA
jgi:hypothetical protein